ncbi:DUF1998 domain-containing protein [Nitrospira defluvii]|uniref:MrfA-like Zn-binding domain-containing protein n=1 Tax=Nitrospira defluvii TaxID=330214 RepID=A0ABM8RYK9_9BACT|nr:DUF1998 domain-containing protein [Nitrospira defluvii]CAE6778849.1 conserved hypothetical protein [Nitrospira defluvii]
MNELGELRPSQLIYTFGIGALLDLPNTSGLILGLDDWDTRYCTEITEDRLLGAIQRKLGAQVKQLYLPPISFDDDHRDPAAPAVGIPVALFPRWLRCPLCDTLATIESGIFRLVQDQWRPDRTRYVHQTCGRSGGTNPPTGLPVRFLLACREGHLTDFPWVEYVHNGRVPCKPARLTLREYGASGDASDIIVKCLECNEDRRMGDAFDRDRFQIGCSGHHPHLRTVDTAGCPEEARTILLGSSNSWFPLVMSALSLPPNAEDKLTLLIEENWKDLKDIPSFDVARYATAPSRMPAFAAFSAEQIWAAIEVRQRGGDQAGQEGSDLKIPEWNLLTKHQLPAATKDFRITRAPAPTGFEALFEPTILLERLREVRALLAFTRIESKGDFADADYVDDDRQTSLSRQPPTWLPASEVRGEGIFLRLKEDALQAWEQRPEVRQLEQEFLQAHKSWRRLRKQQPPEGGFPAIRYVLLHSLSHVLMRQIVLECGYTAASVRERLYVRTPGQDTGPMAGILIYTAASDSEGTLGGLVHLGQPGTLGRQLSQGLEAIRICGSDPLCADHAPQGEGRTVHGACCHACLFAPETSCEKGNRFLDRSALIATFAGKGVEFFNGL